MHGETNKLFDGLCARSILPESDPMGPKGFKQIEDIKPLKKEENLWVKPMNHRMALFKNKVRNVLAKPLVKLGCLNLYQPQIWGREDRVQLGKDVNLNNALLNTRSGRIIMKDGSWCGHNVMLLTGRHDGRQVVPETGYDIIIEENVWLCSGAIILGGVKVGRNSIVGAGAVVTADVPPNSFAVGVPARIKPRKGFSAGRQ